MDKHEEVLKEFSRARLNEEAVNAEKVHFYKTDRRVNPKQEDPFWLSVGELPILVSAPHAVRHYRQKKIKMSDQFTGSIVYLLNKLTGCHAIATTKLYGGDPNVDDPCIYKEKISDFCNIKKVKFVIDIHGAARERLFDVDLGTNSGKNLLGKARVPEILEQNFKDFGLSRTSHDYFPASGPNTVTNYVARELGIPAVQLEINKQYRVPAQNPQGFHRLLGALVKSIKELT
ncbi:N-formylglutamate amidohydrolase [Desulfosporosinus nitroreducens]|uniref:N-formylglutamate amidohydrolase n=1 Tax=Desulfosporosinus nitroreducens TaxID=2018668 RepID=A0ABT8QY26_9FIRM|nr:N-formylglutamate amidohydrolase [Desulfosporosinus nitroreducens]MCO1604255.1 N-formylglutamate amidohydrolase [Desulfosporosinus nitroreducens]MDO0825782.1 N-formylglutamate amidohydrolase [Desulfosporosinus nitroreducens]